MIYVRDPDGKVTEIKPDNIFTTCPICGEEIVLDLLDGYEVNITTLRIPIAHAECERAECERDWDYALTNVKTCLNTINEYCTGWNGDFYRAGCTDLLRRYENGERTEELYQAMTELS